MTDSVRDDMKSNRRTLDDALLRLLPDVFFHPIWLRFIETSAPLLPEHLQSLSEAVTQLSSVGKFDEACQILFVCVVQQLRTDNYAAASDNIQQILFLAEQHNLPQVAWRATWGAAAIGVRRGWFHQAAEHLEHLRFLLDQQQEWVLSNVIEVIRQDLLSRSAEVDTADNEPVFSPPLDPAMRPAIEQLLHWGEPPTLPPTRLSITLYGELNASLSVRLKLYCRRIWQQLQRIAKGELRLQWVDIATAPTRRWLVWPEESRPSLDHGVLPSMPVQPTLTRLPDDVPLTVTPPISSAELINRPSVTTLTLTVYALGTFQLAVNDIPTNHTIVGKSRTVFEYLLMHHEQSVTRDVLMDVFWPNADPDSARNRLNVSLHHVRQALRQITEIPVVLFEEGAYHINAEFDLWIDVEEFDRHVRRGRQLEKTDRVQAATKEYELARDLYQGDFMAEEPYEDWSVLTRERLRTDYLDILDRLSQIYFEQGNYTDCVLLCQLILTRDSCREDAHCRLMQCYSRQNQRYLALRQYQMCVKALRTELDVEPAAATTQLFERVKRHEAV